MMSLTSRGLRLSDFKVNALRRAKRLHRLPKASLEALRLAVEAEEPRAGGSIAVSAALDWGRKAGASSWAIWWIGTDGEVYVSPRQSIDTATSAEDECSLGVAPVIHCGAEGRCLLLRAPGSASGESTPEPFARTASKSTAKACVAFECSPADAADSLIDAGAIETLVSDLCETLARWGIAPESVVRGRIDGVPIQIITPNVPIDQLSEYVELAHLAAHLECVSRGWQMSAAKDDGSCWVRVESVDDAGRPVLVPDGGERYAIGIAAAISMVDEHAVELARLGVSGHSMVTDRPSRFISISLGEAGQRLLAGDAVSEQESGEFVGRHGAPVRLVGSSIEYMLSKAARGPAVAKWTDQMLLRSIERISNQESNLEAIYRVLTTSARVCFEGDPASTAWFIEGDRRDLPAHYPSAS